VGLVALGRTAKHLVGFLQHHDHKLMAFDPYIDAYYPRNMGIQMTSLETLFSESDVVSVHLPVTKESKGTITGDHIRMMKQHATFINTARGAVLEEDSVLEALQERPDVYAVLDVAVKEPPVPGSLFYQLPNVMLTPHIAGALFDECARLGDAMIAEAQRFLKGEPLQFEETPASIEQSFRVAIS